MATLGGKDAGATARAADPTVDVAAAVAPPAGEAVAGGAPATQENPQQATDAQQPHGDDAASSSAAVTQPVYGRYRSTGANFDLELRLDIDGARPLKRVSGDFFTVAGEAREYFGSFQVDAPQITETPSEMTLEGTASFTWDAGAPVIDISIPRVTTPSDLEPATVTFSTTGKTSGATYVCSFVSRHYRTITIEQDSVAGTVPFVSYDTGSLPLPSGCATRTLDVSSAYAEAGVEVAASGTPDIVPVSESGPETAATWSDSELHAAMVNHFSTFVNVPRWQVWLLVATKHETGARGIMFDYSDAFQRQGSAVFYNAIKGDDPASQRAQLRTYVHEIGHAFNLLHSWRNPNPPQPLGPNGGLGDLSWMNYPWRYQPPAPDRAGETAFWEKFAFEFTDRELAHLRHGLYRNVIMGANALGQGAADRGPDHATDVDLFDEPAPGDSGLALELRGREAFEYGEPVVVELKLSTTDLRGNTTHTFLHPKDDFVSIAIRQPSGRKVVYRPLMPRCADDGQTVMLGPDKPAVYESAFIGYGRDGSYFDTPGEYTLRAQFVASDSSRVLSQELRIRVRSPQSPEDEKVGQLLMGPEQGQLLYLLGSDAESLRSGNAALDELLQEHGDHPLAVYARMLKGVNAGRDFKHLTPDKQLEIRSAKPKESISLLTHVVDASSPAPVEGVDDITLNLVMRRLARAQARAGDLPQAGAVLDNMVDVFESRNLKPHVMTGIREQVQRTRTAIAEEAQ